MKIEIIEGSWEHKLLESVFDHREEIANVCMWEYDEFNRACRNIAKQLHHEKTAPKKALSGQPEVEMER